MRAGLLAVVVLLGVARADEPEPERAVIEARAHFTIGRGKYELGDYRGAADAFLAGYRLAPRRGFLINLGQTYRRLGALFEARDYFRRYLAEASPEDPERPSVAAQLKTVEGELARGALSLTPEPQHVLPDPFGHETQSGARSASPVVTNDQRGSERPRRAWVWALLGVGVALIAAAAVALGVVYGGGTDYSAQAKARCAPPCIVIGGGQ